MNRTLATSLVAFLVVCGLLSVVIARFIRRRSSATLLQLLGAGLLLVVVLTHVAEGLRVLRFMHWGEEHSVGHYLDLWSAVLGVALLALGLVVDVRRGASSRP